MPCVYAWKQNDSDIDWVFFFLNLMKQMFPWNKAYVCLKSHLLYSVYSNLNSFHKKLRYLSHSFRNKVYLSALHLLILHGSMWYNHTYMYYFTCIIILVLFLLQKNLATSKLLQTLTARNSLSLARCAETGPLDFITGSLPVRAVR